LMIERFSLYLEKHYHNLRAPHRHSFYHLVLLPKEKGITQLTFRSSI
jgi:hypothetical protein